MQKELLDTELDLYKKIQAGDDVAELRKKYMELQLEVCVLFIHFGGNVTVDSGINLLYTVCCTVFGKDIIKKKLKCIIHFSHWVALQLCRLFLSFIRYHFCFLTSFLNSS